MRTIFRVSVLFLRKPINALKFERLRALVEQL